MGKQQLKHKSYSKTLAYVGFPPMGAEEGRSLTETPTWAVATVITFMISVGFFIHWGLKKFGKWLDKTKRKQLLAALNKIEEELMVFGLLSLLMGHWIVFVTRICVKTSTLTSKFYPCVPSDYPNLHAVEHSATFTKSMYLNTSIPRLLLDELHEDFCPEGQESFASYESLNQLHRFLFVLGVTHVSYSFLYVALAMVKIYSWRTWENDAKTMALRGLLMVDTATDSGDGGNDLQVRRLSSFVSSHTSHPWSQHAILVWLLCFSRQFWSSINQADYSTLRLGFLTTHQLTFTYDFHNYMLRTMEEEFRDIVGISIPLWIFALTCILLGFHGNFLHYIARMQHLIVNKLQHYVLNIGTNIYFWISFLPAVLILVVGTKLHHVVVKLATEVRYSSQWTGFQQFNLRDELFWFGKPLFLLRLIQFVSFQNAFEMAMYLWSMWEIKETSCYTGNQAMIIIRLTFGVLSQFWCSFITFPLYIIVAQMGSKFKKTIVSEGVRRSLQGWRSKVKTRHAGAPFSIIGETLSVDGDGARPSSVSDSGLVVTH